MTVQRSAQERSDCATRAERGAGVPASERVGGCGGAKPPAVMMVLLGVVIARKLRPVEIVS